MPGFETLSHAMLRFRSGATATFEGKLVNHALSNSPYFQGFWEQRWVLPDKKQPFTWRLKMGLSYLTEYLQLSCSVRTCIECFVGRRTPKMFTSTSSICRACVIRDETRAWTILFVDNKLAQQCKSEWVILFGSLMIKVITEPSSSFLKWQAGVAARASYSQAARLKIIGAVGLIPWITKGLCHSTWSILHLVLFFHLWFLLSPFLSSSFRGLASDDVTKLSNAWQQEKLVLNKHSVPL